VADGNMRVSECRQARVQQDPGGAKCARGPGMLHPGLKDGQCPAGASHPIPPTPAPACPADILASESEITVVTDYDPVLPDVSLDISLEHDITLDSTEPLGVGTHGRCVCVFVRMCVCVSIRVLVCVRCWTPAPSTSSCWTAGACLA